MKIWLIFVQAEDHTWLEAAWDDESTAENYSGWTNEVNRVRKLAGENHYDMRIIEAEVPGVFEAFEPTKTKATNIKVVDEP